MRIIQKAANLNGSRPPIQDWRDSTPPEGYAWCPEDLEAVFYSTDPGGFVTITLNEAEDTVTAMEVNQEALDAYLASLPPPQEPQATIDERVTTLEGDTAELHEALDMILTGVTE